MKNLFPIIAVILLAVTGVSAQFMSGETMHSGSYAPEVEPSITVKGYLIDKTCAAAHADGLADAAMGHPRACALKSLAAGLGVVSKGQWFPLDEKGSKKAAELLEKSTVENGVMVQVTGRMHGNTFIVSHIKEIKAS